MNLRRLFLSLYIAVFLGAGVTAWLFFYDARQEYNRLKAIESRNEQRLADTKAKLEQAERDLERLKTDPAFVAKKIEERLGYAKPDETVIRFER